MPSTATVDALVVGSGPNGLAAALTLARAGHSVQVIEARATLGGGTRTAALTLPGFQHDICSAVHPLGIASPFFAALPLADYGLAWALPPLPVAHPLDHEPAVAVYGSVEETAAHLGVDRHAYRLFFGPMVDHWQELLGELLAPLHIPRHLYQYGRFGVASLLPATVAGRLLFRTPRAQALFAGMAGHSIMPLERLASAAYGIMMCVLANAVGWPVAIGGSQAIAQALAAMIEERGGTFCTNHEVRRLDELPPARAILFDLTPRQILDIARDRLPPGYQRALSRYRYGAGVFKVDWALSEPIPWRDAVCRQTATVHLGGTLEEIAAGERAVGQGKHPERPYIILAQPTLIDPTRAPAGQHTAWGYCHVPSGSTVDRTDAIEAQIERFAPGFRDTILARHTYNTVEMEAYNPNYIGGDINGGVQDLAQHFLRPTPSLNPYRMPTPGLYICSSSTPPGGGVHGMCGYHAAHAVLDDLRTGAI